MEAYIDTTVILDAMLDRDEWAAPAKQILYSAADETITAAISTSALTDIFYLVQKNTNKEIARKSITTLLDLILLLDVTSADCLNALASNLTDFEAALVVSVAKRNRIQYIVTRNKKDFTDSSVSVLSPNEFISILKETKEGQDGNSKE